MSTDENGRLVGAESQTTTAMGLDVTPDGKDVIFTIHTDPVMVLRYPASNQPAIVAAMAQLADKMRDVGLLPALVPTIRQARHFKIGKPADMQPVIHFAINPGATDQCEYRMTNYMALHIADVIQQQVFHGMTHEEQQKILKEVEAARTERKLILPPHQTRQ